MLRALKGYQVLQVTMLLVVNHLLVKAVDVLVIDFDMNQFLNAFNKCAITSQWAGKFIHYFL